MNEKFSSSVCPPNAPQAYTITSVAWDGSNWRVTWGGPNGTRVARVSSAGQLLDAGGVLVAGKHPAAIPAEMLRQVWERDHGRCAWTGPDGKRCNSRWQVEVDHLDPAGRGGTARLDRLRLACRLHDLLYAEEVYGREHTRKYRKGESTTGAGSAGVPVAREAMAAG